MEIDHCLLKSLRHGVRLWPVSTDELVSQGNSTFTRSLAGKTYLFRNGWDEVLVLDGLGNWLWESIAEPCSVSDLALDVSEVLGLELEAAEADISSLVAELSKLGAVKIDSASLP